LDAEDRGHLELLALGAEERVGDAIPGTVMRT
jgi:hypothetical protein